MTSVSEPAQAPPYVGAVRSFDQYGLHFMNQDRTARRVGLCYLRRARRLGCVPRRKAQGDMRAQARRRVFDRVAVGLSRVLVAGGCVLGVGCTYQLADWGDGARTSSSNELDGETDGPGTVVVVPPTPTASSGATSAPAVGNACENGALDVGESAIDCGGGCTPCAAGARCDEASDCESGVCASLTCQSPSCDDGVANGGESGVDCGSADCGPCPNGESCRGDEDCIGGVCSGAKCTDAQCTDGRLNGDETDVDCGGSCSPCGADGVCRVDADCESGVCLSTSPTTNRCSQADCSDGERNARETDVDCGGPDCPACPDEKVCRVAADCASHVCDARTQTCAPPACDDGVLNGPEFDVDCGGGCAVRCAPGAPCAVGQDCVSGLCDDGVCLGESCNDGAQNQGESDVDCGGPCAPCGAGSTCEEHSDCMSGDCDGLCLAGAAGDACLVEADCRSGWCVDGACQPGYVGAACETGADCHSGYCKSDGSCGLGSLGRACLTPDDCASERCAETCQTSRFSVLHSGGSDTKLVNADMIVQRGADDPARAWNELAIVYFFTIGAGESHVDYLGRYLEGPDRATRDGRFLALNPSGGDWMMVWRGLDSNDAAVPTTATTIKLQLRDDGWPAFNLSNDHSYRSGAHAENANIVVCQKVDGRWIHTQGVAPPTIVDPCGLIVDRCEDAGVPCDVLDRDD